MDEKQTPIAIVPLGDGDWATLRDLRLKALADTPTAFWATLEDESRLDREGWTRFLNAAAWFTSHRDGIPVGLAAGLIPEDSDGEPVVIAMWVALEARGLGAGRALLHAVCEWARDRGSPSITLWVTDGNEGPRRLYERYGFRDTGERDQLPHGERLWETQMRLELPPGG